MRFRVGRRTTGTTTTDPAQGRTYRRGCTLVWARVQEWEGFGSGGIIDDGVMVIGIIISRASEVEEAGKHSSSRRDIEMHCTLSCTEWDGLLCRWWMIEKGDGNKEVDDTEKKEKQK